MRLYEGTKSRNFSMRLILGKNIILLGRIGKWKDFLYERL